MASVIAPDCHWGCAEPDPAPDSPGVYLTPLYSEDLCLSTPNDVDLDGVWDDCEYQLAAAFAPQLVLASSHEVFTGREPHWVARRRVVGGVVQIRIGYLLSYYVDGGTQDPLCENEFVDQECRGHYGDSEWIMLDVEYNYATEHWLLNRAAYSQHDSYGWYGLGVDHGDYPHELEYPAHPGSYPRAYVAFHKHANYESIGACNSGGFWGFDVCFADSYERVVVWPWTGLASRAAHTSGQDCMGSSNPIYSGNGETECYWTIREFGGWQGTYPKSDDYSSKLAEWGF